MNMPTTAQTISQTIPAPPPIKTIFGLLKMMPEVQRDIRAYIQNLVDAYGDFLEIDVMGEKQYIVSNADIAYEVLVKQSDKFIKEFGYRDRHHGLARFFGNGLLTSDGEFWKRQRKLVAPALHTRRIASYAETMVDFTLQQLEGWHDGAALDISREMNALTMKIVSKSLFNMSVEVQIRPLGEALYAVQDFFRITQFIRIPTWLPTLTELRARRASKVMDEFVYSIIYERRRTNDDKGDLLSMLLLAQDDDGNGMNDVQIRDEVLTAFLAGHETTANTMNWTWTLLAQHPEIEAKLHYELDTVLNGRAPTLADLKQLPYTEMVIKESLRLYPPAWSYSREATEDVPVSGGYTIPKGGIVQIFAYGLHRNDAYWENPQAFIPERFSAENEGKLVKQAYVPFGGGPRICVGNAFALMEAQLILATIAQRYTLHLSPGQVVIPEAMITMFPKDGLPMTVQRRQPSQRSTVIVSATHSPDEKSNAQPSTLSLS